MTLFFERKYSQEHEKHDKSMYVWQKSAEKKDWNSIRLFSEPIKLQQCVNKKAMV